MHIRKWRAVGDSDYVLIVSYGDNHSGLPYLRSPRGTNITELRVC